MIRESIKLEAVTCEKLWSVKYQGVYSTADVKHEPAEYRSHDFRTTTPSDNWVSAPDAGDVLERMAEVTFDNSNVSDCCDYYDAGGKDGQEALRLALSEWFDEWVSQDTIYTATATRVILPGSERC